MRVLKTFLLSVVAFAAIAQVNASELQLCEHVAAKLRVDRAFATAGSKLSPLEALSKSHSAELASSSHLSSVDDDSADAYIGTLVADYHADPKLADAVKNQVSYQEDEVWSLPRSDVHALISTSGSAHCAQFLFFQSGHLLPDPPAGMQGGMNDDTDGQIIECYVSRGDLVRIAGRTVFAATDFSLTDSGIGLRLVPLVHRRWGKACRLAIDFEAHYAVEGVHIVKNGPLSSAEIAKLAPTIASAKHAAESASTRFAFGPPISDRLAAAAKNTKSHPLPDEFPLFGDAKDKTAFQFGNGDETIGTLLSGREYLLRIAHTEFGWRDFSDYQMVFYALKDTGPVAVASASVSDHRGALRSVKISTLK